MQSIIPPTDAQLVSDYIQGNEKSLESLIYKHKSKIYNFIFSKVLIEIMQKTFSRKPLLRLSKLLRMVPIKKKVNFCHG